mmetsp:Transcript_118977/g.237165  ORF Transcript_118977/g.237165 Transcript_118977/m.237165 type:complete len:218 (-) Transcript_118977:145-798(-)|eukprot:CAMPEP_0172714596 /NCGR_PEP_ID=MMETSP1074-20121228/66264_1 /TAXON_ID=2916 /ORGANISM="Ceratium fusus, Strain PA161109" /LENGTH=217 /DNA_ID=CAMNT_0013539045 /DNA_START=76 /DNA_END=729 /DNA_ORIENTATION=-
MLAPGVFNVGGVPRPLPPPVAVGDAPFANRLAAQVGACSSDTNQAILSAGRATHSSAGGTWVLPGPATVPIEPLATNVSHTDRIAYGGPLATTTRLDIGSATCIPAKTTAAGPLPSTVRLDNGCVPGNVAWSTTRNLNQVPMGTQTMVMMEPMSAGPLTSGPLHSKQLGVSGAGTGQTQQPGVLMQPVNGGQVITGVGVQIVNVNQNPTGPIMLLDD